MVSGIGIKYPILTREVGEYEVMRSKKSVIIYVGEYSIVSVCTWLVWDE